MRSHARKNRLESQPARERISASRLPDAAHQMVDSVVMNTPTVRSITAGKHKSEGNAAIDASIDHEFITLFELLQRQLHESEAGGDIFLERIAAFNEDADVRFELCQNLVHRRFKTRQILT